MPFVDLIDLKTCEGHVLFKCAIQKTYFNKCKHLEFLLQTLTVNEIKLGDTGLILPTVKFSLMPIFAALQLIVI